MADDHGDRHRLEQIQLHIRKVTQQLEKAQGKRGQLESQLRLSEQAISKAETGLRETRKHLVAQQARLQVLMAHEMQQQTHLRDQLNALSSQVVSSYKVGQQPQLQLLLSQENPGQVSRMLKYYDYLNQARLQEIARAKHNLAGLIHTQRALKAETKALNRSLSQQKIHQADLTRAEKQRRQALAQIDLTIHNKQANLHALRLDATRLQGVLDTIGKAVDHSTSINSLNQTPFGQLKGRLPWPVHGNLAARFGEPRNGSDDVLRWQGTLIRAAAGTPIHAIDAGQVVFADWLRGYGLLLIIDHGHGFMTLYGHDQAIYRPVGTWVRSGEVVASVGNSGGEHVSRVYFAIRHDGQPVNPARWCHGNP